MNADAERQVEDLVARALQHNDERSHDMTPITDIRQTYTRLLDEEADAQEKLAKAREDLQTAKADDIAAHAEAALAGSDLPKRKEVRLKHQAENLEVALHAYVLAFDRLLDEAVAAVGEGRRKLDHQETMLLSRHLEATSDEARAAAWDGHRLIDLRDAGAPALNERPDDIVAFVEAAYEAVDKRHAGDVENKRMREGYDIAVKHVQAAKGVHAAAGGDPNRFSMYDWPDLVTAEDLSFFAPSPGRSSAFQKNREAWPHSIQDEAEKAEPTTPRVEETAA
jgi:hypothetical protein